jgi:hypothetical protein
MYNFINEKKKRFSTINISTIRSLDKEAPTIIQRILNLQNGDIQDKSGTKE